MRIFLVFAAIVPLLALPARGEVITREETYSVWVEPEVFYCYDDSLPSGQERVLTPGCPGELLRRARVTYCDGRELGREVLEESAVCVAARRVVALGIMPEPDPELPLITDSTIRLPTGEMLTYYATAQIRASAYTHTDAGCNTVTSTGTTVRRGTVAVDPRVIPYGTRMFIMASDGSYIYGVAQAEDCGGAIKGDRMDLYMENFEACMAFGRRKCTLYFLGESGIMEEKPETER